MAQLPFLLFDGCLDQFYRGRNPEGSDYPHAEGLADPGSYVHELEGFSDAEIRLVMRENALGLAQRRPASAA